MLKEVLDDALSRGEKLKRDIVGQILKSATLNELVGSKRFAETIAKVIQTKEEISKSIRRNVQDALRAMSIPSKIQINTYEKRVEQLERKIDTLGRQMLRGKKTSTSKAKKSSSRSH